MFTYISRVHSLCGTACTCTWAVGNLAPFYSPFNLSIKTWYWFAKTTENASYAHPQEWYSSPLLLFKSRILSVHRCFGLTSNCPQIPHMLQVTLDLSSIFIQNRFHIQNDIGNGGKKTQRKKNPQQNKNTW